MSNALKWNRIPLLIVYFVLNIITSVPLNILGFGGAVLEKLLHLNMTESGAKASKKRKPNTKTNSNQTVSNRTLINVNWQTFLSSNLIMDKKTENAKQESDKEQFTGTFRRKRKSKKNEKIVTSNTVQNNLETLYIDTENINSGVKNMNTANNINKTDMRSDKKNKFTKFIGIDCEMVGVGSDGNEHMLARVSLVNKFGDCIYDKFVKAREEVTDYRTKISGVRKEDIMNGEEFTVVQQQVSDILKGRVLVGHSLKNDLGVLYLSHPKRHIRDTSKYKPFKKITKGSTPSLKRLAKEILGIDIQDGEHSSVEDARAAMQLYCTVAKDWEQRLKGKRGYSNTIEED